MSAPRQISRRHVPAVLVAALATGLAILSGASADISRDGRLVVHRTVWDLQSGQVVARLSTDLSAPVFSRDGRLIVGEGGGPGAVVVDAASGRSLRTLHGSGYLTEPAFSPDGRLVVALEGEPAVLEDTDVGVWSATGGGRLHTFRCASGPSSGHCFSVELSPDGRRILAAGFDAKARLWDLHSGRQLRAFGAHVAFGEASDQAVTTAKFSPDGTLLAVVSDSGAATSVSVYDAATGRLRFVLKRATDACFSPSATLVATHQGRQVIQVRDVRNGRLRKTLRDPHGAPSQLAFSPDGRHLVSYADASSSDPHAYGRFFNTLRIWDVQRGTVERTIRTPFSTAEYSPDGRLIVTIGQSIQVWDAASGLRVRTLYP